MRPGFVSRPLAPTHQEIAALRALQESASTPGTDHPVWGALISKDLAWLDFETQPATIRLTPLGQAFDTRA
jgi:hypothetical protein